MSPAVESFWQTLAAHGERPALQEGERRLNYRQLLDEIEMRAGYLRRIAARRLALELDNGIEWALWDLAALRAGVVCIPLPGFFSADQQRHVLGSAGVDTLIAADPSRHAPLGFESLAEGFSQRRPAQVAELPAGTLKITYTSGTTGQPKGVCLDAGAQLRVATSIWQACGPSGIERHLCVLPLAVLLENVAGLYALLLGGALVELVPLAQVGLEGASRFDLPRFLGTLQRSRPNSLILLPQLLLAWVTALESGSPLPDSLRFVAVGGGRVAPQLLERAEALGLPVFEGYGLSECASVVCLNTPGQRRIGSVGRPLPHLQVRLADDGEVLVRGARMLGYLGEPAPAGDWLGTGDLGHFEGDFLVLHGRKKHQFVTAFGRNVNPEWVEAELVQQLPIAQAWLHGEAQPANVAVLQPRSAGIDDEALARAVARVNAGLPDYARVHHWLRAEQPFSVANGLATANGRLRRAALFQHYRTAIERVLATPIP
ncbi:AMP-binding protein [Azotobacter chroococcum]|uniref:AMP-binding protein n=1 Tax=Azotobacter chroococcum TaxID=353 RepID=A0AAP9YB47_9GAMM|nr:AMP-binding protein [Azotobacter chroococcum]QQE87519.1 AMP-binding protein [Azotobacter chroococcum]